ncbi:MAG: rhomboid family intramembrane serine protease [Arachnia sp.]
MSTGTTIRPTPTISKAVLVVGAMLALMWALEAFDQLTGNSLDPLGIHPRDIDSIGNIALAPWLHFGWGHLISNSIPFLVLGTIIFVAGAARWVVTTLITAASSGGLVWLISPPASVTAGVSGVIFGYLTYLLVRGFFTRSLGQIGVAIVVFLLYGGLLMGVLPGLPGVSWQGHLGGAIGGIFAAWWQHGRDQRRAQMS